MAKNKLEKPKKLTQVNGTAKFVDGKLAKPETVAFKKDGVVKQVPTKVVEKKMLNAKYARDNLDYQNKFLKRCLDNIAHTTIKETGTSKPDEKEKCLMFGENRIHKIMQCAHSRVAFFSAYVMSVDGRLNIKTVTPEIKEFAEQSGYEFVDEHTLKVKSL